MSDIEMREMLATGSAEGREVMSDTQKGLYQKYRVERIDGSSEQGRKHESCAYFVLDLDHDPYALPALKAYARACRKEYPSLAHDLLGIVVGLIGHWGKRR
jgi:hypothetical protein